MQGLIDMKWPLPDCLLEKFTNETLQSADISNEAKKGTICEMDKERNWIPSVLLANAYRNFDDIYL